MGMMGGRAIRGGALVVGGGITGLAAAYRLTRAGVPVLLAEARERLGGKIQTER
ncbi:MAG TPA: FAD-dependent oxidoreductase, partial [Patescibacteria group bacterium]|nr:FAD-dependent oxidoreductase [Patescibacteria group bacterium]